MRGGDSLLINIKNNSGCNGFCLWCKMCHTGVLKEMNASSSLLFFSTSVILRFELHSGYEIHFMEQCEIWGTPFSFYLGEGCEMTVAPPSFLEFGWMGVINAKHNANFSEQIIILDNYDRCLLWKWSTAVSGFQMRTDELLLCNFGTEEFQKPSRERSQIGVWFGRWLTPPASARDRARHLFI